MMLHKELVILYDSGFLSPMILSDIDILCNLVDVTSFPQVP
jgi:hypothetical protein